MATVSISEARAHLPEVLDRVQAGEEIMITRHGRAVAVILRPDTVRTRRTEQAFADADRIRLALERAQARPLSEQPTLAADQIQPLLDDVAASRTAR